MLIVATGVYVMANSTFVPRFTTKLPLNEKGLHTERQTNHLFYFYLKLSLRNIVCLTVLKLLALELQNSFILREDNKYHDC